MKKDFYRFFLFLNILTLFISKVYSTETQTDTILEHYNNLTVYYPLAEGDGNEKKVFDYIVSELQPFQDKIQLKTLDNLEAEHSFSYDLIVRIPGVISDELFIIIPVDGDNFRAMNVALILEFIDEWTKEPPPLSLSLLFTGADNRKNSPLGSISFLEDYSYTNRSAALYFSPDLNCSALDVKCSVPGYTSPGWFVKAVMQALSEKNTPFHIDTSSLIIDKTNLRSETLPLSYYLAEGIPAIALYSKDISRASTALSVSVGKQVLILNRIVEELASGIPRNWEKNYFILDFFTGEYLYLSEISIVLFFLALFAFSLLIPLIQNRRISLNFRKFRHQIWTAPVLVFLTFQFSLLSTLVVEEILVFRNFPELINQYPFIFFLMKLTVILFLSRFMLSILRGLPFPKNPHFYSYAAVLFSSFNVIAGTVLTLVLSPFFVIIQACSIFFVIVRGKGLKLLFFYLSLIPVLILSLLLIRSSYTEIYNFLILSRLKGNLFLTFVSLPFTAMITSISFYHHHYEKSRHEVRTVVGTVAWGVITLILIFQIFQLEGYTRTSPQQVMMQDIQYLDSGIREIRITSKGDIGNGQLILFNETLPLEDVGTELKIMGEIEKDLLLVNSESDVFLDRRSIDLKISAVLPPEEITVRLHSDNPILFYDCKYPYEVLPDQHNAEIFIGDNPPNPLYIPMIFSKDSQPDFTITLHYDDSPYSLVLEKENIQMISSMELIKNLPFDSLAADP